MNIPLLLAPAGSYESLQAAIKAGADAVYFGIEQLNMRAKSTNIFLIDDIEGVSVIAKANGIKCYLTLNTIIYNHDFRLAEQIIREACRCEIDAVIASDYAVIQLCAELGMPVHLSTQANVTNTKSLVFHSKYADLVVLSRELTLQQIAEINKEIDRKKIMGPSGKPMQIEVFVHGALCMAVSGKCYISLHTQNASANRGACAQNCRRPYKVSDYENGYELVVDNEYIMSAKDLCTIQILDEIVKTGVQVLKIEGRTKSADYVYTTTKCYREALDAVVNMTYNSEKVSKWMDELNNVYNRGFWEGYYLGRQLGEWTTDAGNNSPRKKTYLGKATNYYSNIKIAEFLIESNTTALGDDLMVVGKQFGISELNSADFLVDGRIKGVAIKGEKITFYSEDKVSKGDKLYKIITETCD